MKRIHDDDDGRTIADMSGVGGIGVLSGLVGGLGADAIRSWNRGRGTRALAQNNAVPSGEFPSGEYAQGAASARLDAELAGTWGAASALPDEQTPGTWNAVSVRPDQPPLGREERLPYIFGALKAGLLIAFAYLAGLGLVIALLLFLWG